MPSLQRHSGTSHPSLRHRPDHDGESDGVGDAVNGDDNDDADDNGEDDSGAGDDVDDGGGCETKRYTWFPGIGLPSGTTPSKSPP